MAPARKRNTGETRKTKDEGERFAIRVIGSGFCNHTVQITSCGQPELILLSISHQPQLVMRSLGLHTSHIYTYIKFPAISLRDVTRVVGRN